jgi:hypothetical protein
LLVCLFPPAFLLFMGFLHAGMQLFGALEEKFQAHVEGHNHDFTPGIYT